MSLLHTHSELTGVERMASLSIKTGHKYKAAREVYMPVSHQ